MDTPNILLKEIVNRISTLKLECEFKDLLALYERDLAPYFYKDGDLYLRLTQDQVAMIDEDELQKCLQHSWFAVTSGKDFYARAKIAGKAVALHRFILGVVDPKIIVDHKYHNTLDCRKSNLRLVNSLQSSQNRRGWKNKKDGSNFKGVYRSGKLWRSVIKNKGVIYKLGKFTTEVEAARAYDKKAKELHGEYAVVNFKDSNNDTK